MAVSSAPEAGAVVKLQLCTMVETELWGFSDKDKTIRMKKHPKLCLDLKPQRPRAASAAAQEGDILVIQECALQQGSKPSQRWRYDASDKTIRPVDTDKLAVYLDGSAIEETPITLGTPKTHLVRFQWLVVDPLTAPGGPKNRVHSDVL